MAISRSRFGKRRVEGVLSLQAGLVDQGAGQIGLACAGGPGDDQIPALFDPIAGGQGHDQAFVQAPPLAKINNPPRRPAPSAWPS